MIMSFIRDQRSSRGDLAAGSEHSIFQRDVADHDCPIVLEPGLLPLLGHGDSDRSRRFAEFFAAEIRNPHTRAAYLRAVIHFGAWCDACGIADLAEVTPVTVAAYIEHLIQTPSSKTGTQRSMPTVKQALAALRRLFDYLVVGQVLQSNPALSVRGPKYSVLSGKTPALDPEQVRQLFASIETSTLIGLRDRAIIAVMAYGFARIGAVVQMRVEDYHQRGKRWHFRLREKNAKVLTMPAHHSAEECVDAWIQAAGIADCRKSPLFRSLDRWGRIRDTGMTQNDAYRMVKRRARAAGLPDSTRNHTFRATSCTTYLSSGGKLEHAQRMMGHSDPRTTKAYDHSSEKLTLDEVEKITY